MQKQELERKWVEENPCVKRWLGNVSKKTARKYRLYAYRYFRWVEEHGGKFAGKSLSELLDMQEQTHGRHQYEQLDMLERYLNDFTGAFNSKKSVLTAIRSFYAHNRVPLPKDPRYKVHSNVEPVEGKLDREKLKKIILVANRRYRAIFTIMFQSAMGEGEFTYFNKNSWSEVKRQLEEGKERIKVHLPGRKHARNVRPYYIFIGRDGVKLLQEYLEQERGYVKNGEAIFLNDQLTPVSDQNIRRYFLRCAEKAGILKKPTPPCPQCGGETVRFRRRPGPRGTRRKVKTFFRCTKCGALTPASKKYHLPKNIRYGLNPHEMRDVFRSEWDLSPAKSVCAEFFMGHTIDPNAYNKIMKLHTDWAEKQYGLAEPFLNILSEEPRKVGIDRLIELERQLEESNRKVAELKNKVNSQANLSSRVETIEKSLADVKRLLKQGR